MNDIDLVEFCEKYLGLEFLPYQKKVLYAIQNMKEEPKILYARGQSNDRFFFGWIYKKMWENYIETGEIKFPFDLDDNSESFKREYEVKWVSEDERKELS